MEEEREEMVEGKPKRRIENWEGDIIVGGTVLSGGPDLK